MASGFIIRKNQYYDSLFLMGVNKKLLDQPGVMQTAVLMGSPANKTLLADIGIFSQEIDAASPNDLVVAMVAESQQVIDQILGKFDQFLEVAGEGKPVSNLRSLQDGLKAKPNATLAVISIPGEYAAHEARKALEVGLNVFLFSDNVPIEDELELKTLASEKGLLLMGPDCGTSIINGKGIAFANVVRRGAIGVIGAAGTGLQEFTSQVHNAGAGISHAIGTGSHDLSDTIGGITTLAALKALEADPQTKVIAVLSKPPGEKTLTRLLERFQTSTKPIVACFFGIDPDRLRHSPEFSLVETIDDAVDKALTLTGEVNHAQDSLEWKDRIAAERKNWKADQKYIRGLFAGGTFCYQSQQILRRAGYQIHSNSPIDPHFKLEHPEKSREHSLVDMGDDFYTRGKPHPMIDGTWRSQRIRAESNDLSVAILLLDFVLGYNASLDPVGDLLDGILNAKENARKRGAHLSIVASICGTQGDPQDLQLQMKLLEEAGVVLFRSNALAARFCAELLKN